ncbi:nitroreductase family protein [Candidatus Bathyarchaeota archaeon]|nr:nitroreductase family protein [Candidatus Bathyarchaeota archaeon]
MDVFKAIKTRRTIRKFKPKDVSSEPLMMMIDAARWAPSAANKQPWEFIVVNDKEDRRKIAELYVNGYLREAEELPKSEHADRVDDPAQFKEKIEKMKDALRAQLEVPPIHIIVCADPAKSESYEIDTAAAIQNMLLAAHALGLGTAWIDLSNTILGKFFDKQALKNLLDIPDEIEVMAIIPVGYPDFIPPPPPRRIMKDIIHRGMY